MLRRKIIYILLLLAFRAFVPLWGSTNKGVDTIMRQLRESRLELERVLPDFYASYYINGNLDILNRGKFIKSIPLLRHIDDGRDNYYAEFIGGLTFTNPNIYNQSIYSISSNKLNLFEEHMELIVAPNVRLAPYSRYLYGYIYSPLAYQSWKYYSFEIDSTWYDNGNCYYRILFSPKINSNKFVMGEMTVTARNWSLRDMKLWGKMEFQKFEISIDMGNEFSPSEFLPRKISISTDVKFFGTRMAGNYTSVINYEKITPKHITSGTAEEKEDLNVTLLYNMQMDTLAALANKINLYRDSVNNVPDGNSFKRDGYPGNVAQGSVTQGSSEKSRTGYRDAEKRVKQVGTFMIKDRSLSINDVTKLSFSPIISPILFNYSSSQGLSYTQKVKYTRYLGEDRGYSLRPRIGYNFKFNEFYWGMEGEYNYLPQKMGRVFFDIGNGNKIYARTGVSENGDINSTTNGFRSSYARIGHKIEAANGFTVSANAALMQYVEIHNSTNRYTTFVPEVELQYTPYQYYYMDGKKKTYLYSRYPTFTLNFAHAFKGVMNSTTKYNKLEFDMQQKVQVGPMHSLHYRIGLGIFYDYENLYFAQFNNLRRNNLPEGWDDDIGGTFHLLNSFRYNEIDKYLRANAKYDAPLLLLGSLLKNSQYITKERLYCNLLLVDTMDPYIELGYGIGTNIFNAGFFWGGEITKWDMFGIKFTFEIFNN